MKLVREMHYAQFKVIPPLDEIKELFTAATGVTFHMEASWTTWQPLDADDMLIFRPYIRKCHQKILMETVNGIHKDPCSFLRQLVRPHGFLIVYAGKRYTLTEAKEEVKVVEKKAGTTVDWTT